MRALLKKHSNDLAHYNASLEVFIYDIIFIPYAILVSTAKNNKLLQHKEECTILELIITCLPPISERIRSMFVA